MGFIISAAVLLLKTCRLLWTTLIGCLHETGALRRSRVSVHEGGCQSDEARHSREGNAVGESCPRPCLSLTSLGSGVGVTGLILKAELYERLDEKDKETGTHGKG